jgi:hypothetical protein
VEQSVGLGNRRGPRLFCGEELGVPATDQIGVQPPEFDAPQVGKDVQAEKPLVEFDGPRPQLRALLEPAL